MSQQTSYDPSPRAHPGLHIIALIELSKGLISASAATALALVGPLPIRTLIANIGKYLHFDTHHSALARFIEGITPETVHLAATAVGIYAVLRFVLFWGLWRVKAWASWLGACAAMLYVPFCLFALWRYPGWPTAAVLVLNLIIVWVLVRDLRRRSLAARQTATSNR